MESLFHGVPLAARGSTDEPQACAPTPILRAQSSIATYPNSPPPSSGPVPLLSFEYSTGEILVLGLSRSPSSSILSLALPLPQHGRSCSQSHQREDQVKPSHRLSILNTYVDSCSCGKSVAAFPLELSHRVLPYYVCARAVFPNSLLYYTIG